MPPVKFTEQWLAGLQPGPKKVTYWDATVTGFCVLVGVAGKRGPWRSAQSSRPPFGAVPPAFPALSQVCKQTSRHRFRKPIERRVVGGYIAAHPRF